MRLRNKITVGTSIVGFLLLVLGLSGAWYVLQLQRLHSRVLDVNVTSIRAAEELEMTVREIRHELDQFLISKDPSHLVQAQLQESKIHRWINNAVSLSSSDQETQMLDNVQQGLNEFFVELQTAIDSSDPSAATSTVEKVVDGLLTDQVLATAHRYLNWNERELQASNEQNKAMAERLALALLLLGTCGAIAGLVVGYGIARGIRRSILQLSVPIRDVAGKLNEVVGPVEVSADPNVTELETILQEVSEKVATVVEQLQQRHREIIRSDQLATVGQLAAGLAHEIRNPLMCMKTLVQAARRNGEHSRLDSHDLAILDEEISRLNNLLQAFLDFARPAIPDTNDVDLIALTKQTVELVSGKAKNRVQIECEFPDEPIVVRGDESQLRQVLLNLLLNSLDAVSNGGAIWVSARLRTDKDSGHENNQSVTMQVTDNGRGLPVINRDRIFEPFFSTRETGLGLGLAISKRIIEAHDGVLKALDREQGGTIFEIELPSVNIGK